MPCSNVGSGQWSVGSALGCSGSGPGGSALPGSSMGCDSATTAVSCLGGANNPCAALSHRQSLLSPHLPIQTHGAVTGILHRDSFSIFQVTPPHTNFALRVALHTNTGTRAARLLARKDLPPSGRPLRHDDYELNPRGDGVLQRLVIPPSQLGCGQRDTRHGDGVWPDLLHQAASTRWLPIERELVGSLYPPSAQWRSAHQGYVSMSHTDVGAISSQASLDHTSTYLAHHLQPATTYPPHCDTWYLAVFPVAPPPPAPFQPSLVNESLSDDFVNPPTPPPAFYTLTATLEPHYTSFACLDCAPPLPPPSQQFTRSYVPPPPPAVDRYGSTLEGDCEACGMRLRGTAERVIDEGGQRIRLVHSARPFAATQRGAVWHHAKLDISRGFEISFEVQFQRPSNCAQPASMVHGAAEAAAAAAAEYGIGVVTENVPAEIVDPPTTTLPRWRTRATGCGGPGESNGKGAETEGAIGGEGMALVVHNDPAGLEAIGCAKTGVGYARDSGQFGTCLDHISNSIAVQLSPHYNVTEVFRMGPQVAAGEPGYFIWGAMDEVGVYTGGVNNYAHVARGFAAPGRKGKLIDGKKHTATAVYAPGRLQVYLDGEIQPTITANINLTAHNVADTQGKAWVGFTASTGISSIDTDLTAFSFCEFPGCDAA